MVQLGAAPSNERWVALLHQNMVRGAYACCNSQTSTSISTMAVTARCNSQGCGQASVASILDGYINVEVQGMSQLLHAQSNTMTLIQSVTVTAYREQENISMWCKAFKKTQFF